MAYSDYGAFVYLNGERRTDKEDVGVYDIDEEFDFLGWHFHFWGDDFGGTPKYGATMSRDGEAWECDYDYMFGAGFDDIH